MCTHHAWMAPTRKLSSSKSFQDCACSNGWSTSLANTPCSPIRLTNLMRVGLMSRPLTSSDSVDLDTPKASPLLYVFARQTHGIAELSRCHDALERLRPAFDSIEQRILKVFLSESSAARRGAATAVENLGGLPKQTPPLRIPALFTIGVVARFA